MPPEQTLKFSLLEDSFPSFADLKLAFEAAGYNLSKKDTRQQHDRYYDDVNRTLKRQGLILRRRTVNAQTLATLKRHDADDDTAERAELEMSLTDGQWPSSISRRVSLVTDPANLRSVLDINTHRAQYRVEKDRLECALLSFDEVSAGYPLSEQSVHFNNAELEAVSADDETLKDIADLLDSIVRLSPNSVDGLERAEALLSLGAGFQND